VPNQIDQSAVLQVSFPKALQESSNIGSTIPLLSIRIKWVKVADCT